MFDYSLAIANGLLCAAAIVFAAHVGRGRHEAICLAMLLLGNFLFCALGYTEYAPKHGLARLGLTISTKELWAISDAVFGCLTVAAFRYWWAWALWAGSLIQVTLHGCRITFGLDEFVYTDGLQIVLLAQIAVFLMIGGRGVGNRLHRCVDRIRLSWGRGASALSRQPDQ